MRPIFLVSPLFGIALAIDNRYKSLIEAGFEDSNASWKAQNQISTSKERFELAYENLTEGNVFLKESPEKTTFSVAVPENRPGSELAMNLIKDISTLYGEPFYETGARVLQNVLRKALMTDHYTWDAKVSVIYATRNDSKMEILNVGSLWVGLYRDGKLLNSTNDLRGTNASSTLQSGNLIQKITQSPGADFSDDEKVWFVKSGDILMITWADLHSYLGDVVDLAVASADANHVSASQILASLKPYFEINRIRENVLIAVKLN